MATKAHLFEIYASTCMHEKQPIATTANGLLTTPNNYFLMQKAVSFVLDSQFVQIHGNKQAFKVTRGSGVGMKSSGEIADCTFLSSSKKTSC